MYPSEDDARGTYTICCFPVVMTYYERRFQGEGSLYNRDITSDDMMLSERLRLPVSEAS